MEEFDLIRLRQLLSVMGHARLLALAGELADGLAALAALQGADRDDQLHRLRGGAASLGFAVLAADLAAAETGHGDVAALVDQAPGLVARMDAALHALSRQR